MIISIIDFVKDIIYIILYPHSNDFIILLLWMGIFVPFGAIYSKKYLGNRDFKKSFVIYMSAEKIFPYEDYKALHKLEVLKWVGLFENVTQIFCFCYDFLE